MTPMAEPRVKRTGWTRDLITSLIAVWIVAGIYLDGWAHVHGPGLETFFTPWHASFYSGLAAFIGWLVLIGWRAHRPGDTTVQAFRRLPTGYRAAAAGAAIFAFGGVVDGFWHELLGVEVSIDALLSPPHLVLLSGVLLMGSAPWRSQRAHAPAATVPELISLVSVVAITGFFLNFLSPFRSAEPVGRYTGAEPPVVTWIGSLLVTTVLILVPLLWQLRDGRHRVGTLTALVAALGIGTSVAMSAGWPHNILLAGVGGAMLGALATDLLIAFWPVWCRMRYGLP